MKKKDLEDYIVCFASYLDYHKTEMEKNKTQPPFFDNIYKNFFKLFNEVVQNNRVAYVAYRLGFAVDAADKEEHKQKEQSQ